jgi:hypothetical protein
MNQNFQNIYGLYPEEYLTQKRLKYDKKYKEKYDKEQEKARKREEEAFLIASKYNK